MMIHLLKIKITRAVEKLVEQQICDLRAKIDVKCEQHERK